ncbi:MAG: D-alanine--D-alanine ligase [Pseudomonadota bacterium]|nr:D-alanine--D-alanine ligase [Pseudomonadota bacterium]
MKTNNSVASFGKVGVLFGGSSSEREVSLKSGRMVFDALLRSGVDVHQFDPAEQTVAELAQAEFERVFICLHGRYGEDGCIQGVLELLNIPYTGSGVCASALAMDKWRTKILWRAEGIPVAEHVMLDEDTDWEKRATQLGLPLMVKPIREGSSIGMSKVERLEDFEMAWRKAYERDKQVMAERFISGMELTVAIVNHRALPLIRLETSRNFYDYEAKYLADSTRYICPCGLDARLEKEIQVLALKAFDVLGCQGWGRADVMLDEAGNPYFLEMNTIPGMTDHSLVPMAARQAGIGFDRLVLEILEKAHVG